MNAFERVYGALEGYPVDRPPILLQIGDHAGIISGLTYDVMYQDALRAAEAHLDALRLYGDDLVTIQVEPSVAIGEACGARVAYPPDKNPWITDSFIKSRTDLERLQVPVFMATQSSRVMIEGTRILAARAEVPVAAFMSGPITFSLQLMTYTELVKEMYQNPAWVHRLVRKSLEITVAYAEKLKEAGATVFVICEHGVTMLSPEHVKPFVLDYLPELLGLCEYNVLHMCGNVLPHLRANTKHLQALDHLNMVSISSEVDIAEARRLMGGKIGVAGNIDHNMLLPFGEPAEVEAAVHDAIKANNGNPRFMIAAGCEITADTPVKNVKALVAAAISGQP